MSEHPLRWMSNWGCGESVGRKEVEKLVGMKSLKTLIVDDDVIGSPPYAADPERGEA